MKRFQKETFLGAMESRRKSLRSGNKIDMSQAPAGILSSKWQFAEFVIKTFFNTSLDEKIYEILKYFWSSYAKNKISGCIQNILFLVDI